MREEFEKWLQREMPAGTVISDPLWWAPRIWQAARATPALPQTPQNACSCDRELKTGWTADNRIPLCNVCGMVDVSAAFEMSKEAPALPQGVEKAAIEKALRRAFNLGQTYWQQADSESYSQNRKSDETLQKFNTLVAETSIKLSGMAIVPVEPTEEMVDAAEQVDWSKSDTKASIINMWQAMFAASQEQGK